MKFRNRAHAGFTLVELLVAIGIIAILSAVVFANVWKATDKAKVTQVLTAVDALKKGVKLYRTQMGFYPPDINRGWDPGLAKPLPWNPDTGATTPLPVCSYCPSGWETWVPQHWDGPYISDWPKLTPWKGKYDFNYWPTVTVRYGCTIPAGVYIGVQGDYVNGNLINPAAEQILLDKKLDADKCLNGEAQILMFSL